MLVSIQYPFFAKLCLYMIKSETIKFNKHIISTAFHDAGSKK